MGAIKEETASKSIVLVGIDFSAYANEVLQAAEGAATSTGSELHLVHVLPLAPGEGLSGSRADREIRFAEQLDQTRQALDRLAAGATNGARRVAGHIRVGSPDVEIAQVASDIGADLIVVGTHGNRGLDRLLLGSVAESLVRNAPCPVLIWRPKSVPIWNQIEPPCPDCLEVQRQTGRSKLWCERHSQRHGRPHTYYEVPEAYGIGAQTFR